MIRYDADKKCDGSQSLWVRDRFLMMEWYFCFFGRMSQSLWVRDRFLIKSFFRGNGQPGSQSLWVRDRFLIFHPSQGWVN